MLEGSSSAFPALQSAISDTDECQTAIEFQPQRTSSPNNMFLLTTVKSKGPMVTETKKKHQLGVDLKEDINGDKKPPGLSYIALISMAIQSAKTKKMLLSEIYQWISDRYPYYQLKDKSWRNSIRHNLSLNECFVKSGRSENGKGNYWSIHPANMEDFSKGDYRRRRARRRVRICDKDLQQLCVNGVSTKATSSVPKITPYDGYIPMASTVVPSNFMTSLGPESSKNQFEWYPSDYYQCKSYDFKPIQTPIPHRDSMCAYQGNMHQPNTDYFSYGGSPTYFPNSSNSCAQAESKFNVNVSVNVCGNNNTEQQPSPSGAFHRPSSQHDRQIPQPEQHQIFTPHYQSAFSSHYTQMYGTIYQENLATPIL